MVNPLYLQKKIPVGTGVGTPVRSRSCCPVCKKMIFLVLLSKRSFLCKTVVFLLKDESHGKAEILQRSLHAQYKRAATENILITNNLNSGEHLKSIGKPANLIVLLYEHPSIDQRFQNPAGRDYPGEFSIMQPQRNS